MFEYNGQQFTLAEVEEAAANKKMSLDQYINQFGIKKIDSQIVEKPQPAAEIAAPAVGQTPDMGSQLESGSSELQPNVIEENFNLNSIKFQFDKGNFKEDQRLAYEEYKSTGKINESLLGEKNKVAANEKGEKLGVIEALNNAYSNVKPLMYSQMQNAKAYGYQLIEEFGKQGVENTGFGISTNVLDTPKQSKLKEEQALKIDNAFNDKKIEAFNEAEKARKLLKTTGQGLVEGVKQGDLASIIGGAANGLASVITSAVPAMAAGAAGTIAGGPVAGTLASAGIIFGTQLAPQFYADFNIENAKAMYPNLSEQDAVAKMFEENKEQVATPTILAAGASTLELAGVKGLSRGISKNLASKMAKDYAKAMLALGGKNGIIAKAYKAAPGTTSSFGETLTELGQLPLELINQAEAKKLKGDDYLKYVWENFLDQAPEVAAQSFVGSRIFVAGGSQLRKATKIIRDHAPVHTQGTASNSLFSLGVLKQRQALTKDPQVKQGMQDAIEIIESQLKTELKRGNKLAKKLTEKDINTVIKANDDIKNAQEQIENLQEQKEFGLDDSDYQMSRDGFQLKIKQADQKISEVLNRVADESAQNIRNEDGSFTDDYKNELEKIRLNIIKPTTSKVNNQKKLNNDLIELQTKLDEGLISETQYEADLDKLTSEYATKTSDTKNKAFKVNESVKSVKESSIQASKDLQKAFDDGVANGTITKDKDGKNIISDKPFKSILKTQQAFIKKLSNQVFNSIPQDLRIGTKAEYESNLETELLDVLRTYNRSIPLGAYVQNILRKRSVSPRALQGVSNQTFNKDIESSAVQGMISEEDSEIAPEIKNIETAQALNISNDLLSTIKNAAKKALATVSKKVDDVKFKSDVSKSFKDDLYKLIKDAKGLKNTKTNPGLTKAIEESPEAFYNSLSVESMRMARAKGGVNPFEQAGLLKRDSNDDLQKVKFSNDILSKFLNYYTDESLKPAARSDRQMNLIEALVTSMGAREAINLLENDIEFRQRFADQQQQEQSKNVFDQAANKIKNIFQKSFVKSIKEFAAFGKTWKAIAKDFNIDVLLDSKNEADVLEFQNWVAETATRFLPRSFFTSGTFAGAGTSAPSRNFYYTSVEQLNESIKNSSFAKEDSDIEAAVTKQNYTSGVGSKRKIQDKFLKGLWGSAKLQEQNKSKLEGLKKIFLAFESMIKEDPNNAKFIIAMLSSTSQGMGGFVRVSAPINFIAKNLFGVIVEEHTLPASLVAKYLFNQAMNQTVNKGFDGIKNNYFQGALAKIDDNKLAGLGPDGRPYNYKERTPPGWTLLDNIWARYFNKNVNSTLNGIDPNNIVLANNKTVAEEFNVGFDGSIIPDVKKLQQEAIAEQTEDQVENLIDRAIAKLTELTGTEGTLQTNIGAVPINIIIGGLRATKLAYQGGKALADAIADGYKKVKDYMSAKEWSDFVTQYTSEVKNEKNPSQVKLAILSEKGVAQVQEQARKTNEALLNSLGVETEGLTTEEIVDKINTLRKAKVAAANKKAPTKKARVFDFDDTLAKTKSNVLYTLPDGTSGSLDATQFAEQYSELQEAGATFDYSEFSQVKDGSKGPLAVLAKRFTEAKGDRDVFVLTARPADSAKAIQEFLRSTLGISIPLQNITGLANGKPSAKAFWIAEKVSEGYNDVFFADDAAANVKAVASMLDNLGVTKRVQQAKETDQKSLEDEMDSIIRGKKRSKIAKFLSKINIYIPPGADDFAGLLQYFQTKGKLGEEQMQWFQDNLLIPFSKGIAAFTSAKVTLASDFKELNKRFKNTKTLGVSSKFRKLLDKKVLDGLYTNEQAVRAYLYDKAGEDLGINKADAQDLISLVEGNSELKAYADELSKITKLDTGYPLITEQWLGGNIESDMATVSNRAQRKEFLQEFINNKNQIFSEQNMKLIKQVYGNDFTDALKNILERMETGQNRKKGKDKEFNAAMNWINQSVGAVMSINMRSALLQQMSIVNYLNWNFNNPIKMGLAMANVPQFMKDYIKILNSDFLKERRGGMAIEVNLSDIADSTPGNLFQRLNKKVLELGFKPTQWGDSNAIAFGGASWYRNRYNQLIKEGLSESEADAQAMLEFQEVTETSQQSSRVDKVSRQQASDIGRLILAFANTPLQYARETRKATSDLINGRGDWRTNASKIIYYGVAQNLIFTALQQGLFSLLIGDDDDDEEKRNKKLNYAVNGVLDGILRGMGYAGAVVSALKNLSMEYYDQYQKRQAGERVYDGSLKLIQKGLSISPPISKKIGDIVEAQKFETWRQYKNDPFYQAFAYANYVSGITNLPVDRVFKKIENLKAASLESTETWQSLFLSLGWSPYNVGVQYPKKVGKKKIIKISKPKELKQYKPIGGSKRKKKSLTGIGSGIPKVLPKGVLGRANRDGSIEVAKGLSPTKKKQVIAHEQKHQEDMQSGKLDYDKKFIYWNNEKYKRTADKKINYKGKLYIEGSPALPWEKAANKAEKQIN